MSGTTRSDTAERFELSGWRRLGGLAALLAATAAVPAAAAAAEIYFTDFESFPVGADTLVGTDGWLGTNIGEGVHGIDADMVPGLGQTAYVGFNTPSTAFVTVYRPSPFSPSAETGSVVEFNAVIGIADSTNGRRDNFYISIYNQSGELLGALNFDNTTENFGIWRYDGSSYHFTGAAFLRDEVEELFLSIDFAGNVWTAELGGVPVFSGEPFSAAGSALNLGSIAAEWEITAPDPADAGDNWFLFDEWSVSTPAEPALAPLVLSSIARDPVTGHVSLSWLAQKGFSYQVEYSSQLEPWASDLPNSTVTVSGGPETVTFIDTSAAAVSRRNYRVIRVPD